VNVGGSYRGAGSPLQAYGGGTSSSEPQPAMSLDEIQPLINQAIANWEAAGLDAERVQKLRDMEVRIADLTGPYLGMAYASTIYIDTDAAGYGWFVDQTPEESSEFGTDGRATDGPAAGRMDLLTALTHELGHALGLDDLDSDDHADDLMGDLLPLGVRRMPMLEAVDSLFANDGWE
jgi:hypothetical protein